MRREIARIKTLEGYGGANHVCNRRKKKRTDDQGPGVVCQQMQKTVVVAVENVVKHGMYQKYIRRTSKFLAHNESAEINVGDRVVIEESRPLSKRKRWTVREVVAKA